MAPLRKAALTGVGTLFRSTLSGAFNVVYPFQGGAQAGLPGMLLAGSNALYGVAGGGAPFNGGIVYSLTPPVKTICTNLLAGPMAQIPAISSVTVQEISTGRLTAAI